MAFVPLCPALSRCGLWVPALLLGREAGVTVQAAHRLNVESLLINATGLRRRPRRNGTDWSCKKWLTLGGSWPKRLRRHPEKATYLTSDNQMTPKPNLALNAEIESSGRAA